MEYHTVWESTESLQSLLSLALLSDDDGDFGSTSPQPQPSPTQTVSEIPTRPLGRGPAQELGISHVVV